MVREIKKQFVIIVLTIFLAVAADQFIEFIIKERAITNEKALVVQQLDTIRARLEGTLNANFNLVNGMSTAITINPDMGLDTFNDISKELLKQDNQLINIAAAPDLIIRYVYPLEGNEAILGIDYRQIPDQREAILQAIGLKQILLAGPVNLIQGGRGLILRIPIFVSVDLEPRFWGILSSVIDIEKLFKRAELLHSDIEVSIKGSDSKGEAGAIIYGRSDLFELNPILQQVNLPNGSWVIAAIPKNGWDFDTPFQLPIRLSIILLSLYFLYQYRLSMKQTRLRKLSEAKFSASFDRSTLGMMLSKGDRSTVLEINEVMCRIFEVSKPTVLNANFLDLGILPKEQVEKIVNLLRTDGQIPGLDLNFINSAGENRQLWFNASTIEIEGEALLLAIAEDITELKLKDERNQRIADSLTKAQAMANMGNWEWDAGNQRLICSEQTFNIIGWDYQNFLPTQQDFLDIVHPDDIAIAQNLFRSPEGYIDFELRIQRTDGEIRNIRQKTSFLADETGNPCHIFGTIQDITEQKQQFKDWELAKQVLDNTSDGIIVTELDGTILDVNSAFTQITGYSRSEAINKKPSIGKSGRHDNQFYAKLWQQLIQTGHWSGEIWDRKKNGSLYPKWLAINTIKNEFGEPDHYIGIFSDISAIKQAEEKLEKLAYYDPLTGLPNRELFQDRLGLEMNKAKRYGTKLALIYLDLDRFKNINDSLEIGRAHV